MFPLAMTVCPAHAVVTNLIREWTSLVMTPASSLEWWQNSLAEVGVQGMERLLPRDATWEQVLASGRDDFAIAQRVTGMQTGANLTAVEIGCGVGRMTQALGQYFGRVIGLDVAPLLLEQARQRNTNPNITFEQVDGQRLHCSADVIHTVFSYEVLYILEPKVFGQYVRDAFQMLTPNGEFVFQMNVDPLRWTTRLSYFIRRQLWKVGVKEWRGWPTGPGFQRYAYTRDGICQTLTAAGFEIAHVHIVDLRRAWFLARKPRVN
jgi:SAM-dependent methyltransferase